MSHALIVPQNTTKAEKYSTLLPQVESVIADEPNLIANLANVTAMLKETFGWFWVGFYLVDLTQDELVLGPFQGTLACTRISKGRGVCGAAWQDAKTIVVEDVACFPGHIACSSESRSEIVVPIRINHRTVGVLDIDSVHAAEFNNTDAQGLEAIGELVSKMIARCK